MSRTTWRAAAMLAAAALSALAAAETRRIFELANGWGLAVVACAATALVGIGVGSARLRVRLPAQAGAVLAAASLAVVAEGGRFPLDVVASPVTGLVDLLGARWPVPVTAPAMAFVTLLAGIVSAAAVELAHGGRFRVAVVLPPVGLLGLVALFGAPAGPPRAVSIGAFAAVAVVALWAAQQHGILAARPEAGVPRVAMGRRARVPLGAVVVGTVAVAGLAIPAAAGDALRSARRYDPRNQQTLRTTEVADISPLARLDEFRSRVPAEVLFTAASGGFDRWRLVGLTRYDGQAWMPSADFRPIGRNFDAVTTDAVPVAVTIGTLRERWMPWPGEVDAISTRVRTDSAGGGLLLDEPTRAGEVVTVKARRPETADLPSDRAVRRPSAIATGVDVPASIALLAIELTKGATSDYERAQRIEGYLKSNYQLDSQAIPGHTLVLLQAFLDQTKRGRDEQFVAAFAVLAASAGLPVRVVVGFTAQPDAATGAVRVTSDDIVTWPEVQFERSGWTAFDPVPEFESPPTAAAAEAPVAVGQNGAGAARPAPPSTAPSSPPPADETPPPAPDRTDLVVRRVAVVAGSVLVPVALVAGYVVLVTALKRRRRRRLRGGATASGVSGAFVSAMDVVVDLGGIAVPSATNAELVDRTEPVLVSSGVLDELAQQSTAAVFGPRLPDPGHVEAAWADVRQFESDTAQQVGRWRWWRSRVSVRSLRHGLRPEPPTS